MISNSTESEGNKTLVIDEKGKVYYSYNISNSGSTWSNWDGGRPCEVYGGIPVIDGGNIIC